MSGATHLIPYTLSRRAQGQLHVTPLYITLSKYHPYILIKRIYEETNMTSEAAMRL
jgi:hypothetical protein